MPFYIIPLLDIRNACLMITISSTPVFVIFNCLEGVCVCCAREMMLLCRASVINLYLCSPAFKAMYGTSPPMVENDMWTYCMYYSSPIPFLIKEEKKEFVKASKDEIIFKAKGFLINMTLLSLFFTLLIPLGYAPFPNPRPMGQPVPSFFDFFNLGHLLNNYIVACLTYISLDGGMLGVAAGISLMTGFSTVAVMHSPMTESSSPSDFWGRRWNRMIHAVLKVSDEMVVEVRFR